MRGATTSAGGSRAMPTILTGKRELLGLGALPIQERAATGEPNLQRAENALSITGPQACRHRGVDCRQARVDLGGGPCRCPSAKLIAQISRNFGHRRYTVQQRMEIEARASDDEGRPMLDTRRGKRFGR